MKKILLIISLMFLMTGAVQAKNVKVEAMSDFSTDNPPKVWKVKIAESFVTKDGFIVEKGSVIEGRIQDVKDPARLKRNAVFTFIPTEYYDAATGKKMVIKQDIKGKYSPLSKVNTKSVAKNGAIMVGNKLADGFFGPGFALVEGAVRNEQGNRAKSAVVSVYESTPLSYISKGKPLEFKEGQVFLMSFKFADDDTDDEANVENGTSEDTSEPANAVSEPEDKVAEPEGKVSEPEEAPVEPSEASAESSEPLKKDTVDLK